MNEDQGSVGISPAEKPSPSLASEACEPSSVAPVRYVEELGDGQWADVAPADVAASVVRSIDRFCDRYLGQLEYRQTGRDPKNNGFAFAAVPDWALRQLKDSLAALNGSQTPSASDGDASNAEGGAQPNQADPAPSQGEG